MSDVIHIPAGERGKIRILSLDMPPEQAKFLSEPGALEQVLGSRDLDRDHVEIFPVKDLEELGLLGYLSEGCGIPDDSLAPHKFALDAQEGWVLILRSRAFGGQDTRLTPAEPIQLIAELAEPGTDWSGTQIQTESAKPHSAPKLPPREARARARRIGFTLFAIMMTLITFVILALVF
ncbi:MAG: hypothetical protein GJ676_20660 [Rhodobacteraceae bacterium]|nr:hypothetical protein [Paracoccaceae bacterium]